MVGLQGLLDRLVPLDLPVRQVSLEWRDLLVRRVNLEQQEQQGLQGLLGRRGLLDQLGHQEPLAHRVVRA